MLHQDTVRVLHDGTICVTFYSDLNPKLKETKKDTLIICADDEPVAPEEKEKKK